MKMIVIILIFVLQAIFVCSAQTVATVENAPVRIAARPAKGFAYPYYLYVPETIRKGTEEKRTRTILVLPNNSGKTSDDPAFQEDDVVLQLKKNVGFADRLGVILIEPVFPRPTREWKIYTHALDRDSMLTDKTEYKRFDLQLVAMIDDAIARLKTDNVTADKRVLMLGFSASGMFVNRFTFLHPKRVKAAVIGSPGGWPIAPVSEYQGKTLRYPIGTADLKAISGKQLDIKNLRRVPLTIFMGDRDENDSVTFRDSYENEDEDLIFALFGKTPLERWDDAKRLYQSEKLNAEFRLYPNVAHTMDKEMIGDIFAFLKKYSN